MAVWGNLQWGVSRWWERYVPVSGAVVTIGQSVVTAVTGRHTIEGGSTMPEYQLGDVIKLSANFQNNSVDVDPSAVTLKVKSPVGTISSYVYGTDSELVKDSVGDYSLNYTPSLEGRYAFRWVSTGTNAGADEGFFDIAESQFN